MYFIEYKLNRRYRRKRLNRRNSTYGGTFHSMEYSIITQNSPGGQGHPLGRRNQ